MIWTWWPVCGLSFVLFVSEVLGEAGRGFVAGRTFASRHTGSTLSIISTCLPPAIWLLDILPRGAPFSLGSSIHTAPPLVQPPAWPLSWQLQAFSPLCFTHRKQRLPSPHAALNHFSCCRWKTCICHKICFFFMLNKLLIIKLYLLMNHLCVTHPSSLISLSICIDNLRFYLSVYSSVVSPSPATQLLSLLHPLLSPVCKHKGISLGTVLIRP